jgi:mTERF
MPVADMERVAMYLTSLEVPAENLGSIFRSFPALLTLDIRKDMVPVIAFLRTIGVTNMGRFISRLPPVLGYSVRRELVPKWRFLQSIHADARFEVSKFPAYFSYPLERVIKTRYEYIQQVRRIPPQLLPLDKVVSYGDNDFAVKIMGDVDGGKAFRQFVENRRKRLQKERGNIERPPCGGGAGSGGASTRTTNNGVTTSTKRANSHQKADQKLQTTQAKQPQQR